MTAYRKRTWIIWWCVVGVFIGILGVSTMSAAGDADGVGWVSKIVSIQGTVRVKRHGQLLWQPVQLNDTFFVGDQIHVGANSRAGIVLSNDALMRLDQNSFLNFTEIEQKQTFIFKLLEGAANFFSHRPRSLKILTPFVNGVIEGTEFLVQVDSRQTRIELFEGRILAQNDQGMLELAKGYGAVAQDGKAPQRYLLVRPRESVQWAMYYPPVLALEPGVLSADVNPSLALFNDGQFTDALARLESISLESRDATFYICRAAMRLHVGRIAQAQSDIERALSMNAKNSEALALKAVIAVVQNQATEAVDLARQAVQHRPRSASAHIAYSYALQAQFKLSEALGAAQEAVVQAPGSGLAWARLADLQLSVGALDKGVNAAQKAVELAPRTAHAHTILGFAHLTRIDTRKARESFNEAIILDSAAPLPRMGLGLAVIRDGNLELGRLEIEIAAGLDPGNSLIRSYLGKAYFDEKRDPQDGQQFEIAKTLDPNDPTPWFYDAIRKQSLNRPVEALRDLQKSIELNDNRAIYRSRLMLDEDLAARSASLGRIYNDLGFQQTALAKGRKSVNLDPSNYSAHRFLSDSYSTLPRHEIARVSELLQSQMLQPLNVKALQPQIAESNLFILEGMSPGRTAWNEYNSLFNSNHAALQLSGVAGENDTFGDEIVAFGLWNQLSLNVGHLSYQTDGFRENNDQKRSLYNVIGQYGVSNKTTISSEIRYSKHQKGDLPLRFYPDNFAANLHAEELNKSLRLGLRHQLSPSSHLLGTVVGSDFSTDQINSADVPFSFSLRSSSEEKGVMGEFQHIYMSEWIKTTTGIGYFNADTKRRVDLSTRAEPMIDEDLNVRHLNVYLYGLVDLHETFTVTLGASGDFFDRGERERDQVNPKIGLTWYAFPSTTVRAAVFRVLKRSLFLDQTLEPTQVAGFNQFYDDNYATDAWAYGLALDQDFNWNLSAGLSILERQLEFQFIDARIGNSLENTNWREKNLNFFLNWAPTSWLSVNIEHIYENFERDDNYLGVEGFSDVVTNRSPITIGFFHPSGAIIQFRTTYFDQDGKFENPSSGFQTEEADNFWVLDTSIQYRLPKRLGMLSFNVLNLLDEDFRFQDTDPANPSVWPKRTALIQLTVQF